MMPPSDGSPAPLVTVVIPAFNAAASLGAALDSVLCLPCRGIELVVIDGGSTDGTVEVLRDYEERLGYWSSEPDRGVYDAMNKGVRHGRGKWFYFLGADDTVAEGFCRVAAGLCDPSTIYYGDAWMPTRGIRYDGEFSPLKLALRNICHQSIFYPRCVFESRSYDLRYPVLADYALNLSCFADPRLSFRYVPEVVAVFRDDAGISQFAPDSAFEADRLQLVRNSFPLRVYLAAVAWHGVLGAMKRVGLYRWIWRVRNSFRRIR